MSEMDFSDTLQETLTNLEKAKKMLKKVLVYHHSILKT